MLKRSAFDLFCGIGGLSIGAELAGLEVLGGVDGDAAAVASYAQAFPGKIALQADLFNELPREILCRAQLFPGDVDVLLGGPPC